MQKMVVKDYLLILGLAVLVTLTGADLCYDATRNIENGHIACTYNYEEISRWNSREVNEYRCGPDCFPGYQRHPRYLVACKSNSSDRHLQNQFEGTWDMNIEDLSCVPPSTCQVPKYLRDGSLSCSASGDSHNCTRRCTFPYVPSEPEYATEHCGPDTQYFWSYVLRHNKTELPPCERSSKCADRTSFSTPANGRFICKEEAWAQSTICQLHCSYGYIPINSNTELLCGPSTAFQWSQEWPLSKTRFGTSVGCIKSPVTAEVTLSMPCESTEKEDNANQILTLFEEKNKDRSYRSIFELVSWDTECINEKDSAEALKYYFNFKELCRDGTCKDACDVLPIQAATRSTLCREMCKPNYMHYKGVLSGMRNISLNHIGNTLASVEMNKFLGDKFRSMAVTVADEKLSRRSSKLSDRSNCYEPDEII